MASRTQRRDHTHPSPSGRRWFNNLWVWAGALVAASWVAAGIAIWRGHSDAIENWRRFLSSLSAIAAQHADQTVAAADSSA